MYAPRRNVVPQAAQRRSGTRGAAGRLCPAWVPARASLARDDNRIRILLLVLPLLAAFAATAAQAAEVRVGDIVIADAWGRASVGTAPGALYLTLRNEGSAADRLVGAETPLARLAELHVIAQEGEVMTMGHADGLDLPAGETVTLAPGGTHIMLMGLAAPLKQGESVPLTLHFDAAGAVEVSATIGSIGAKGPPPTD